MDMTFGLLTLVGQSTAATTFRSLRMIQFSLLLISRFTSHIYLYVGFTSIMTSKVIWFVLQAYWDWSWDELVAYDLPANIDYIYQQTGTQSIHYVGHSLVCVTYLLFLGVYSRDLIQWTDTETNIFVQGTLIMLASLSQHKLLSMLRSAALLCPIAYVNQMSSLVARDAAKIFVAEVNKFTEHIYLCWTVVDDDVLI